MFGLAAFVFAALGQELWRGVRARRAMSDDSVPRAVVSLVQRNRRRYGGYLVHIGISVLFAGVAASSAFQDARDVELGVGQTAQVGGYDVTYVKPTADLQAASNGRLEKIDLGARDAGLARRRDGRHAAHRALVLPLRRPVARADLALLRGRGDERGRAARRAAPRRLERDLAERARPAQADRARATRCSRRRRRPAPEPDARSRSPRRSTGSRARTRPTRRPRRSG